MFFKNVGLAVNLLPIRGDVTNVDCKLLCLLPRRKVLPNRKMGVGTKNSFLEDMVPWEI